VLWAGLPNLAQTGIGLFNTHVEVFNTHVEVLSGSRVAIRTINHTNHINASCLIMTWRRPTVYVIKDDSLGLVHRHEPRQTAAFESAGSEVEQDLAPRVQIRNGALWQRLYHHVSAGVVCKGLDDVLS